MAHKERFPHQSGPVRSLGDITVLFVLPATKASAPSFGMTLKPSFLYLLRGIHYISETAGVS
jgi:hypothetical protein